MEDWLKTSILLCAVGFFKSVRPSEAFLTQYLLGRPYNLTNEEISYQVYPVATYAYLAILIIILLITDFVRYKPIIILEGMSLAGTYIILIWGNTLPQAQAVEFLYALSSSAEVAYYTYIYAKVPKKHYLKVTSYTRTAVLCGFFISGVIGQSLITTKAVDFGALNYVTLVGASIAILLAFFLPSVMQSIYFHQEKLKVENEENNPKSDPTVSSSADHQRVSIAVSESRYLGPLVSSQSLKESVRKGFWTIQQDLKDSYKRSSVLKWSLWWACATCLNLQIGNYIQPLWEVIYTFKDHDIYNGAIESTSTLLGAASALAVGYIHCDWCKYGELVLTAVCFLNGVCLFVMAETSNIWVAYTTYVTFRATYQMVITIASYQVAKDIREDSYGLIFGCNTFIALLIQTLLVFIVVDSNGLACPPRTQFLVYAGYATILGIIFLVTAIRQFCKKREAYNMNQDSSATS